MLWIKGVITTQGVLTEIFLPSLISMIIPAAIISTQLKGRFDKEQNLPKSGASQFTKAQRTAIFWLGVGGLVFVPIFKTITHLPPFMGILLVLGILWVTTEIFHHDTDENDTMAKRVSDIMSKIDLSTIMFFLGILMAVAVLSEVGVLTAMGQGLNEIFQGNHYLVTGIIGVLSSIVDNVPLVAGCMGMYPVEAAGDMAVDGAAAGLLCRRRRFDADHRFSRWCCCDGSREDYLRLVHEEDFVDCLRRLSLRYHLLLVREERSRGTVLKQPAKSKYEAADRDKSAAFL